MTQIGQSKEAENYFRTFFEGIDYHESFKVMLLNRSNKILGIYNHTTGGQAGCVIDVKMIVQSAILSHAKGVIVCHYAKKIFMQSDALNAFIYNCFTRKYFA